MLSLRLDLDAELAGVLEEDDGTAADAGLEPCDNAPGC